jgi:hypothetical protein
MSDKVLPSRTVIAPVSTGTPGELPQTTAPNPTQREMNAPSAPTLHNPYHGPFEPAKNGA